MQIKKSELTPIIKECVKEVLEEQKILIKILNKVNDITEKFIEKQLGGHITPNDRIIIRKNLELLKRNLQTESKQLEQVNLDEQFRPKWMGKLDDLLLKLLLKYLPSTLPRDQVKRAVHLYVQSLNKIAV